MNWYHISNSKSINKIAKSNSEENNDCLIPRIPEWISNLKEDDPYKEPEQPPRICVAPSVWQCVSGLGRAYGDGKPKGILYAYEISTKVVCRTFESPETVITDEHWIIDEVIEDGTDIKILGRMKIEPIFEEMKNFTIHENIDQMKALDEWKAVWSKENKIDDLYELKLKTEDLKKTLKEN